MSINRPLKAQVEWGDDNKTLVFRQVKTAEVLSAVQRTQLLAGDLCPSIVLDLSAISTAYSAQVLPLVVVAQRLQARGVQVELKLPSDAELARLFRNANWAHLLSPQQFEPSEFDGHHLAATRYASSTAQQHVVNQILDLLLEETHINRDLMGALEWALNETSDNVLTHARSAEGGIVQVTRFEQIAHIVVCDAGRGIGASMREGFPDLADDTAATRRALLPGVTSGPGQGNGLAGLVSIASLTRGEVSLLSGHAYGQLNFGARNPGQHWQAVIGGVDFPGTAVTFGMPLDVDLDLREALSFQSPDWEPIDYIELRYEPAESGRFELRLVDEHRGFSSRDAGRAMRTKVENLLRSSDRATVLVDFSDVRIIASSFADEFLGKLRLGIGPAVFDKRIGLANMSEAVQTVLAGAISQRMRSG